jgi:hypothetical protein
MRKSTFHLVLLLDLAGTYNYTVADANGCIATTSVTIDAAPAQITLTTHHKLCVFGVKRFCCFDF